MAKYSNPFKNIILGMVMREPCCKCLVKACCSKICKTKNTHSDVFSDGIFPTRLMAWLAFIDIVIILPWAFATIVFK